MVAIAPNTFFFFQPKKDEKFAFTTHSRNDPALLEHGGRGKFNRSEWRIQPEEMITNGASVPRQLWYIPGFAPFDFTRAALIHDWLFEAHHRWAMANQAFSAAKARGDEAALRRNQGDLKAYARYAHITQDDAADIFAECIKVAMTQTDDILKAFGEIDNSNAPGSHRSDDFADLKSSLRYNRSNPRTLWAYHYFVSSDAFVKKSTRMWEDNHSEIAMYRFLTSPDVRTVAREKGYLSPWLLRRFDAILKREEQRHRDFQRASGSTLITLPQPIVR